MDYNESSVTSLKFMFFEENVFSIPISGVNHERKFQLNPTFRNWHEKNAERIDIKIDQDPAFKMKRKEICRAVGGPTEGSRPGAGRNLEGQIQKRLFPNRSFLIYNIFSLGKLCCLKLRAAKRSLITGKFRRVSDVLERSPRSPGPPCSPNRRR